ncbi:hypothetical protein BROUX41_000606 [Berkeleyomyces rouxiae]
MHFSAFFAASALVAAVGAAPIPLAHHHDPRDTYETAPSATTVLDTTSNLPSTTSASTGTVSTAIVYTTSTPSVSASASVDPWAPSSLRTSVTSRSPTLSVTLTEPMIASYTSASAPTRTAETVMKVGPAFNPANYAARPIRSASPSGRWLTWSAGPTGPLSFSPRSSSSVVMPFSFTPVTSSTTPTSTSAPTASVSSLSSMTSAVSSSATTTPVETALSTSEWRPLTVPSTLPQARANSNNLNSSTALTTTLATSSSLIPVSTALELSTTTSPPASPTFFAALANPPHTLAPTPLSSSITSVTTTTTVFVTLSTANLTMATTSPASAPLLSLTEVSDTSTTAVPPIDAWRSFRGNYSLSWSGLNPASPAPVTLTALPTAAQATDVSPSGASGGPTAAATTTQVPSWPSGALSAPTATPTAAVASADGVPADAASVAATTTVTAAPTTVEATKTSPVKLYGDYPLLCIELRGDRTVPAVIPTELLDFLQES